MKQKKKPKNYMSEVQMFVHCSKCQEDKPKHLSPSEYSMLEAGINNNEQIEVWCKRHRIPVAFFKLKHPPKLQCSCCQCSGEEPEGEPILALGEIMMSHGISAIAKKDKDQSFRLFVEKCVLRHATGDSGDLDEDDKVRNFNAMLNKGQVLSSYNHKKLPEGKLYVITSGDRSNTTIILPHEY